MKKVKFTCAKCGAVHVVTRGEDGEVEVELQEKPAGKPKKEKSLFDFIFGDSEEDDEKE